MKFYFFLNEGEAAYSDFKFVSKPISLGKGPDKALTPKVLRWLRNSWSVRYKKDRFGKGRGTFHSVNSLTAIPFESNLQLQEKWSPLDNFELGS